MTYKESSVRFVLFGAILGISACSPEPNVTSNNSGLTATAAPSEDVTDNMDMLADNVAMGTEMTLKGDHTNNTPPIDIDADDLSRAIGANEYAAEQKYGGHALNVTGTVDSVGKPYVDTADSDLAVKLAIVHDHTIEAQLAHGQEAKAINLAPGDTVHLLCNSYEFKYESIWLYQCSFNK